MKKIISKLSAALFALSLFIGTSVISSCKNPQMEVEANEKAYITFSSAAARTIYPSFDADNFSNYVLKGGLAGEEESVIGMWDNLNGAHAEIVAGTWNFTLTAKNGSATLEGILTGKAIVAGNNQLDFILNVKSFGSTTSFGSINVSVTVPETVKCVKAGLFDVESGKALPDFKPEILDISSRSATYKKNIVSTGTYIIKFFMYGDEEGTVLLNTYSEVIIVASEASSTDTETITSVNDAFEIEYDYGKGAAKEGKTVPSLYSIFSGVLLPSAEDLEYPDHIFAGWYETADFTGSPVTEIKAGTQTGNKKYYARWAVQGNYILDASAVATKIGELEADGAYTIKATGACSRDDILKIRNVISGRQDIIIYLDFSATSGLTGLETNDFQNCKSLYGVILPSSITTMGAGVFAGCSNLVSITIPFIGSTPNAATASATTVFGHIFGTTSFAGSTAVKQYYSSSAAATVYIPDSLRSVTVLGGNMLHGAFYDCTKLTTINLPDSISVMGDKGLYNCSALKDFVLPSGVTSIGKYEFFGCSSITDLRIPKKVTTINDYAFQKLAGLKSLSFEADSALTTIGNYAFVECTSLESLDFSNTSLETINTYAFKDCTSLASVNISSGKLLSIKNYAFQNCSALSNLVIPKTVTSISSSVLSGCSGLTSLTLPFVGSSAASTFRANTILFGYIFGAASYTGSTGCTQYYYDKSGDTSLKSATYCIPSGLNTLVITGTGKTGDLSVQGYAFFGISTSMNVTLKGGSIQEYCFSGFTGLKTFYFGVAYANVPGRMFSGCTGLTSVSVKISSGGKIGTYAFNNCSSLKTVNIPEGTSLIDTYAFYGCKALPEISIPASVTEIGNHAFRNCSSLSTVVIPSTVKTMGSSVFNGCSGLTEITVPFTGSSATATGASEKTCFGYIFGTASYEGGTAAAQQYAEGKTATYYIPTTLTKVNFTGTALFYGAFSGCSKIQTINIPSGIESIPAYYFAGCSSLKQAPLPSGVTDISAYAFSDCKALTTVSLPLGVTLLREGVFQNCTGLKSFTITSKITDIQTKAFYGCAGLTSITVPETVASIGIGAFGACTSLTEITVPYIGANNSLKGTASNACFGYIFGNTSGVAGTTATTQKYSTTSVTYYIPDSLKKITVTGGSCFLGAFSGLANVEEIILNDKVNYSAQDYIFYNSKKLKKVTLPAGITNLGNYAFQNCSALTTINGISALTGISEYAFNNCTSLTALNIPSTVNRISKYAFDGCTALSEITIPEAVTKIETYSFRNCSSLKNFIIPSSITAIENYALNGCSSIESLTVPDSVESIGQYAFGKMTGLTTLSVPFVGFTKGATTASSTTLFGYWFGNTSYTGGTLATQYYSSSSSVNCYIPTSLKTVYVRGDSLLYGAFYNCSSISLIDVSPAVTSIGTNAFYTVPAIHYHGSLTSTNRWGAKTLNSVSIETVSPSTCTVHGTGNKICFGCGEILETGIELELASHDYAGGTICVVCGYKPNNAVWERTSTGNYQWTKSGDTWTSGNYTKDNTSSISTWTIEVLEEVENYTFKYTVSSESNYDKLSIVLDDVTICSAVSGEKSQTVTKTLTKGIHTISATYSKDSSTSKYNDCATLTLPPVSYQ